MPDSAPASSPAEVPPPPPVLKPPIGQDDHVQPADDAIDGPVVDVVEYGDFQCPHCAKAAVAVQQLRAERRVRFAFRHFPLTRLHPLARRAAEASEAAVAQGGEAAFWAMHDLLFARAPALAEADLVAYAAGLGLAGEQFAAEVSAGVHGPRVQRDVGTAARSGVNGTPTFFVAGRRHRGAYDLASLRAAVDAAAAGPPV